jgi:hypothetical protein
MNIKKKFLKLTSKTYPHGTEDQLKNHLPKGYKEDGFGNYYIEVGINSNTMFTCHLDTADRQQKIVRHILDGNIIKTDGTSILGADDKAGMTIMLNMIENKIPGLYYFFIGEERGCVGSRKLSQNWSNMEFSERINKCISFDRRGTDSVITEQFYGVCCSIGFAKELSNRLNSTSYDFKYCPDPTGIYTDSAQFTTLIPECTNISVGYYSEHTTSERQDILHLENLCKAVCEIDWETLPILRNDLTEWSYLDKDDEDEWEVSDDELFEPHNFTWVNFNGKTSRMMISTTHIEKEKETIYSWLKSSGNDYYIDITWDGQTLYGASCSGSYEMIATRNDLMDYISELTEIPINHLKSFI